jgi:hypothetical protein
MQHHRFREQLGADSQLRRTSSAFAASGFLVCPAMLMQGGMQVPSLWQQIYQVAYERARAVLAPSRPERLLSASRN